MKKPVKASKRATMGTYYGSSKDRREDRAIAAVVGMPVADFKKTPEAKAIDRQVVKLLNRKK